MEQKPKNVLQFLQDLNKVCHFNTMEGKLVGPVSNSELRRWCQNGAVLINGEKVAWDEPVDFPIISMVLFPNNPKKRCTLF